MDTLADIEVLSLRCRSNQSREYLAEAIGCYRAAAYRAAIVSTWIAVVFDLMDKIRELAISGEAAAQELQTTYEGFLAQMDQGNEQGTRSALEFERNILSACKGRLQFFDQQQLVDLERLREDRHRCAHPTFQRTGDPYIPSAEQARLHIRNAVVHVLASPPVQGKAALAEIESMVASDYFPTETPAALVQLRGSAMATGTESLVRTVISRLLFGFFDMSSKLYKKRQVVAALNAIREMCPALVEERFSKHLGKIVRDVDDVQLPRAASFVAVVVGGWRALDLPAREKLVAFVRTCPANELASRLKYLSSIDELRAELEARISQFSIEELALSLGASHLATAIKERALQLLSEVKSWGSANTVFTKSIFPIFESLSASDLQRIIEMPTTSDADLPGATAYSRFIEQVRESKLIGDAELDALLTANKASYLVPGPPDEEDAIPF